MSDIMRPRYGTKAENDGYIGLDGEISIDRETQHLRIHDGVTAGGAKVVANQDEVEAVRVAAESAQATAEAALPKTGGEMSGAIVSTNGEVIRGSHDYGNVTIRGGTAFKKGSQINAFGKDHPDKPGWLEIYASNEAVTKTAVFKPDGTFAWDGKNVITSAGGQVDTLRVVDTIGMARTVNNDYLQIDGGQSWENGASINLNGKDKDGGTFSIYANNGTKATALAGSPDGQLFWNGNSLALKPDFSSLAWIGGLPWTAPVDCFVMICVTRAANSSEHGCVTVNGVEVLPFQNVSGMMVGDATTQFWVKRGDVVSVARNATFFQGFYCGGRF